MEARKVRRGVLAAAGVLALAAAVAGTPAERAAAAGAGLQVGGADDDYTLKAEPFTDYDPNVNSGVTLSNTGTTPVKSYSLTIDYTSLGGVVDVIAPFRGCKQKSAGIQVCTNSVAGSDAPAPGTTYRARDFRVRSLKGARGGDTGEIRVSGQADGVAIPERVWKVDVQDSGLVPDRQTGAVAGKVEPGAVVHPGMGFTSFGADAVKGTTLFMSAEGAAFQQEFSNCQYGTMAIRLEEGDDRLTDLAYPAAVCHFDDTIAVGDSFDVSPGTLKIAGDVRSAVWRGALTSDPTDALKQLTDVRTGKGPELKLVPRPADAPPGQPAIDKHELDYRVDNTTDIAAVGASAEGRPGDVLTVQVGYRNNGPAGTRTWTGSRPIEDPTTVTTIAVPPGTTAVRVPDRCRRDDNTPNPGGGPQPGGRVYLCAEDVANWWIGPGERQMWSFGLRIDKASALKPGTVSLKVLPDSDSDRSNDTAAITVKVPGAPTGGGTGGSGGSSSGSSGSSGSGSTSGSGAVSGASAVGSAHNSAATPTGSMASTGVGSLPWIAGAAGALALALGSGLFVTARRRRG